MIHLYDTGIHVTSESSFTLRRQQHIFHYFGVVIKWVLHPNITATATEKMDIMATNGVHTDGNGKQK